MRQKTKLVISYIRNRYCHFIYVICYLMYLNCEHNNPTNKYIKKEAYFLGLWTKKRIVCYFISFFYLKFICKNNLKPYIKWTIPTYTEVHKKEDKS